MSEIKLNDYIVDEYYMIKNAVLYDLEESIAASKYPMQINPDPKKTDITESTIKLAQCELGTGHDNWLVGPTVVFDLTISAKMLIEAERYHWWDIVSCNSTMHRISKFDIENSYIKYTDKEIINRMKIIVQEYNEHPTKENYLKILYSNPSGFMYTMRVKLNYRQLKTIYVQRRTHRLIEWNNFCSWIETLPHSDMITGAYYKNLNNQYNCITIRI